MYRTTGRYMYRPAVGLFVSVGTTWSQLSERVWMPGHGVVWHPCLRRIRGQVASGITVLSRSGICDDEGKDNGRQCTSLHSGGLSARRPRSSATLPASATVHCMVGVAFVWAQLGSASELEKSGDAGAWWPLVRSRFSPSQPSGAVQPVCV